jgi:cytochrome c553
MKPAAALCLVWTLGLGTGVATAATPDEALMHQLGQQLKQEDVAREEATVAERMRLLQIIKDVESDSARRAAAIAEGADRSLLCASCHGRDGNSKQPDTPNLASQHPAYLLEQIELFATGQRRNFVMQSLAANFSNADKVNLAIYYSSMPVQPAAFDANLAARGQRIYDSVCFMCHAKDGKSAEGFARIAGQKPEYVAKTLHRYRANAQGKADPLEVKRTNPRMEQVTQNLSDQDIRELANYVASLR